MDTLHAEVDLRQEAERLLDELCAAHPMGYRPTLVWKGALRVSAGMAYFTRREIGLSPHLLVNLERLRTTLVHEYAHLLAVARHGRGAAGHGVHWRAAMLELGASPEVRHRFEVQRNRPRQIVAYLCRKCGQELRRNRRLPKRRKYGTLGAAAPSRLPASAR